MVVPDLYGCAETGEIRASFEKHSSKKIDIPMADATSVAQVWGSAHQKEALITRESSSLVTSGYLRGKNRNPAQKWEGGGSGS